MNITIRPETKEEFAAIDELVLNSFAKGTPYSDGKLEIALDRGDTGRGILYPVAVIRGGIGGRACRAFSVLPFPTQPFGGGRRLS